MPSAAGGTSTLHVVVLAAGASTRFGSPKQLIQLDGRPLLQSVVSRAVDLAGHDVIVVLGAHAARIAPGLRHTPATIAINRNWEEGIASSIRVGVAHLPAASDGVLLMLADQPAIRIADLRRLADTWRGRPDSIVAAQYAGITGTPAIFPRWMYSELAELRGDRGAQPLLQRHAERVVRLPMSAAALDIDRPEDLQALESP